MRNEQILQILNNLKSTDQRLLFLPLSWVSTPWRCLDWKQRRPSTWRVVLWLRSNWLFWRWCYPKSYWPARWGIFQLRGRWWMMRWSRCLNKWEVTVRSESDEDSIRLEDDFHVAVLAVSGPAGAQGKFLSEGRLRGQLSVGLLLGEVGAFV